MTHASSPLAWFALATVSASVSLASHRAPDRATFPVAPVRSTQDIRVVVHVLADADGSPLTNAEVIDRTTGARALTRETGDALVRVFADTPLQLRIRQLGFTFADRTVRRASLRGDGTDTLVVRLARIPFALPPVATTVARDCPALDAQTAPLALWALGQLREGAERYDSFRKAYPFKIVVERRTSTSRPRGTPPKLVAKKEEGSSADWGEPYEPGDVVRINPLGFSISILFLANLGDRRFWDYHCVTTAAVEGTEPERRVRLHFSPSPSAKGSEWEGDAVLDSANSLLQRIEFKLAINQREGPRRLEGLTTFRSPSPLIVVPDSTAAIWWRNDPPSGGAWGEPDVVQLLVLETLTYGRAKPPVGDTTRTSGSVPSRE